MKLFLITFLFMIVGSFALPQQAVNVQDVEERNQRIVTNAIREAIAEVSQAIRDAGLDPVLIHNGFFEEKNLLFTFTAFLEHLSFTGLSNIAINRLDYSLLLNRLQFDFSLPEINFLLRASGVEVTAFGATHTAGFNGTFVVSQTRIVGDVRINVGIISGISIRSLALNFRVASIQSNLNLNVFGTDYSSDLNNFFNVTIPDLLTVFRDQIDSWLTDTVRQILDDALSNNLITKENLMLM